MFKTLGKVYGFFVTLPDRLYPFSYVSRGRRVRGLRSYKHEFEHALKQYGAGHFGYKLSAYRQVWHLLGSILFITSATIISKVLFGSDIALYVLLISAIIALTVQEFYVHPRKYGQLLKKGVADWFVWVVPMTYVLLAHLI